MPLLTLRNITIGFGGPNLLNGIDLKIEAGERLCLIGRNGSGKSTLLKIIDGELIADDGERVVQGGANISRLTQEVPHDTQGSIFDVVASGLGHVGDLLRDYHHVSHELGESNSDHEKLLIQLERIQHRLEAEGGWSLQQKVDTVISRLQLDPDLEFGELSGGLKRRVLLARALVEEPDLLLLDEPTNHLDIESITWMEEFLLGYKGALLFITHDRSFLQRLATRIIELDRGRLSSWPGDYANYLRRKEEQLHAEAEENARFDKRLAEEEVWIRQGIKARRTRNEGRVRALEAMRNERSQRRERQGTAKMALNEAERSGKLVVEAKDISFAYQGKPLIKNFSTTIMRGDKIGLIGPNGSGKTTLLQLLLGQLKPNSGEVKLGTNIEIAYFDQYRAQLNGEATVIDNVSEGRDQITVNGKTRHIISHLQDFLFTPERAHTPVKALSGGERNRLLLAKLFINPANVLVMDEPTNDLDTETLELLEELVLDYSGTLLLVSHDRAFLDNVVTSTLVFEGQGRIGEYVGGYNDWLRQSRPAAVSPAKSTPAKVKDAPKPKARKLSYKDQRELDTLPKQIEALEAEQQQLQQAMAEPGFYQQDMARIGATTDRLEAIISELEGAYERWAALEDAS